MTRAELLTNLRKHIPESAVEQCADWMFQHRIKFTVTRSRVSKLGDYRPPISFPTHRISVNHNLNKYAFLVTFVHEIAHLTNWEKHKNKVMPHGSEWKYEFQKHIQPMLVQKIFPDDIDEALNGYMRNPAASTCTDKNLYRILKRHDADSIYLLLENLPEGTLFKIKGYANTFKKGHRIRSNFHCEDVNTNAKVRVSPIAEVEVIG